LENFNELSLSPGLKRAILEMGFEKPSPIQAQALPLLVGKKVDFIGLAATGTGKTGAFGMPLLESVDPGKKAVQAVILCPTRELCLQVTGQINLMGKHLNLKAMSIYGGAGYEDQIRGLRQGIPIVVGTPGRMIDHLNRGTLKLNNTHLVVLDEADEMISMGFREAMETIMEALPEKKSNIWLFSATMSPAVRKVADDFLHEPKMVQVNRKEMLSSTVEQFYYRTHEANKPDVLCKLIDGAEDFYGVIFCQTKSLVVDLTRYLRERGYKVDSLQGDMSQSARETAMMAFRQKRVQMLVCTDVAARGLDVKDVTHVVNYSIPRELDNYVHRIGRTARSGKSGIAMSLVTPANFQLVRRVEQLTKSKMKEGEIPSRKKIGMKKISAMLTPFKEQRGHEKALGVLDESWKEAIHQMTSEEVAARFLSMMYPWLFEEERTPKMSRAEQAEGSQGGRRVRARGDSSSPRRSNDSKDERRGEKRRAKRDFKKKTKSFRGPKGNSSRPSRDA